MRRPKTSPRVLVLALALALGVAVLDHLPRLEGLPWYDLFVIPVVWVALWSPEDDVLPLTAMAWIVTFLVLLPGFLSLGFGSEAVIRERGIVVATIWLTVLIALLRKRARRTYKWINLAGGE